MDSNAPREREAQYLEKITCTFHWAVIVLWKDLATLSTYIPNLGKALVKQHHLKQKERPCVSRNNSGTVHYRTLYDPPAQLRKWGKISITAILQLERSFSAT